MKLLFIVFICLFFAVPVDAQVEPSPWPPDPAAIFADDIEVVGVEMLNTDQRLAMKTDWPIMDTQGRAVLMPDGRAFPWPDEIPFAWFYADPDIVVNDSLYLKVGHNLYGEADSIWQLDVNTGEYQPLSSDPIQTLCGPIQLDQIAEAWIWLAERQFCELATGRRTAPLPQDFQRPTISHPQLSQPLSSPDGRMLVILGQQPDTANGLLVYSYDMETEAFTQIGQFERGEFLGFTGWANDRIAVINTNGRHGADFESEFYAYIVADLDYQDVRRFEAKPQEISHDFDDPATIQTRLTTTTEGGTSCQIMIYGLMTGNMLEYSVSAPCSPEYSIENYDYYRVLSPDGREALVLEVDRLTGEQIMIANGEIEFAHWVSRDARYAAWIVDDSGSVDTPPGQHSSHDFPENARLTLVDLQTEAVLLDIPAYRNDFSGYWSPFVSRFTDEWLQVVHPFGGESLNSLIIQPDAAEIIPLDGVLSRYLGNGWAALRPQEVQDEFGSVARLGLYNLETHQSRDVVKIEGFNHYYIDEQGYESLGGDLFQVMVGYEDMFSNEVPPTPIALYTVRVPGVDVPPSS